MNKLSVIISAVLLGLALLLVVLARNISGFSQWYGNIVLPLFVNTLGRLFSPLPLSVFEIAIFALPLYFLYVLFRKGPKTLLFRFMPVTAALALLFSSNAAVNYSRPGIFDYELLSENAYSQEELVALYEILLEDVSALSLEIPRGQDGLLFLENIEMKSVAIDSMKNQKERFPQMGGFYPKPKPVLFSKGMSYLGITGIYSPFTLEANFNKDIPSCLIPFTMCHELAHLKGFMREEEANFIAYLACRDSVSSQFRYSGALNALSYTLNALGKTVEEDLYSELVSQIPEPVRAEMANNRAYWKAHTRKITSVSTRANDTYLKINAQKAGVKSYGLMVRLLLEEYRSSLNGNYPSKTNS